MIQHFSPPMSEKERIERATAQKFLHLYNQRHGAQFKITAQGEHPDIECKDILTDQLLCLEITLLEDWKGDIQATLGRAERKADSPITGLPAISFEEDTLPNLRARLEDKLLSSYGPNTGLVIRQVSILWSSEDWKNHAGEIVRDVFAGREKNYGAGVWILCREPNSWPHRDDIFELSSLAKDPPFQPKPQRSTAERVVGKAMWEGCPTKDFVDFTARDDVDFPIRIESPHGCDEAILIAFVTDEPEEERQRAIQFHRKEMIYYCICGRGKFSTPSQ